MTIKSKYKNLQDVKNKNRGESLKGYLSQYFDLVPEAAEYYAKLQAQESQILTDYAMQAMKGTLSDRDMQEVRNQAFNMWKTNSVAAGKIHVMLGKIYSKLQGAITGLGGISVLTKEQQEQYKAIENAYLALEEEKDK